MTVPDPLFSNLGLLAQGEPGTNALDAGPGACMALPRSQEQEDPVFLGMLLAQLGVMPLSTDAANVLAEDLRATATGAATVPGMPISPSGIIDAPQPLTPPGDGPMIGFGNLIGPADNVSLPDFGTIAGMKLNGRSVPAAPIATPPPPEFLSSLVAQQPSASQAAPTSSNFIAPVEDVAIPLASVQEPPPDDTDLPFIEPGVMQAATPLTVENVSLQAVPTAPPAPIVNKDLAQHTPRIEPEDPDNAPIAPGVGFQTAPLIVEATPPSAPDATAVGKLDATPAMPPVNSVADEQPLQSLQPLSVPAALRLPPSAGSTGIGDAPGQQAEPLLTFPNRAAPNVGDTATGASPDVVPTIDPSPSAFRAGAVMAADGPRLPASEAIPQQNDVSERLTDAIANPVGDRTSPDRAAESAALAAEATRGNARETVVAPQFTPAPAIALAAPAFSPPAGVTYSRPEIHAVSDSADNAPTSGTAEPTPATAHSLSPSVPATVAHKVEPVAPPSLIEQIRGQISEQLDTLRHTGRMDLQMDLRPPELGPVRLHLALEDGNLNVRFVVPTAAVKRLLDEQLEPLRVRFAEMGVGLGQFNVRQDGGSAQHNPMPAFEPPPSAPIRLDPELIRQRQAYFTASPAVGLVDVLA